jgi:hypothetical protein
LNYVVRLAPKTWWKEIRNIEPWDGSPYLPQSTFVAFGKCWS